MKEIAITSKGTATKTLIPGQALRKMRYCTGKYIRAMVGKTLTVADDIFALWTERRKNRDGVYYTIFCLYGVEQATAKKCPMCGKPAKLLSAGYIYCETCDEEYYTGHGGK